MLLRIGWMFIGTEILVALIFGFILWYSWSRSAMDRPTALKAISLYALGCALCILFGLLVPL